MSLIQSYSPKPDLFLIQFEEDEPIDVTNYKIDDLFDLAVAQGFNNKNILCLYENSELNGSIISEITFMRNNVRYSLSPIVVEDNIEITEITYNNKTYYIYI